MKKTVNVLITSMLLIFISCTMDGTANSEVNEEVVAKGIFAFSDIKGSYQIYTKDGNVDTLYGDATYITDNGISTEVTLTGAVELSGSFSLIEDIGSRAASGDDTNITIEGTLVTGDPTVSGITDETGAQAALTFFNDPQAIFTINSIGEEAFILGSTTVLYAGPPELPPTDLTANFVQNHSGVATFDSANGTVTIITVYTYVDTGIVEYIKQVGIYDPVNKVYTVDDADRYSSPDFSIDSFIANFILAAPVSGIVYEDGTVVQNTFWTGRSWNRANRIIIY